MEGSLDCGEGVEGEGVVASKRARLIGGGSRFGVVGLGGGGSDRRGEELALLDGVGDGSSDGGGKILNVFLDVAVVRCWKFPFRDG